MDAYKLKYFRGRVHPICEKEPLRTAKIQHMTGNVIHLRHFCRGFWPTVVSVRFILRFVCMFVCV